MIKVGINGFGRIGRLVFRVLEDRPDFEVVAVNELGDAPTMAYLLEYDTTHGRFSRKYGKTVRAEGNTLLVGDRRVAMTSLKNPAEIPWDDYGVQIVVESTGVFRAADQIAQHYSGPKNKGVQKVLLTVPPKGSLDPEVGVVVVHGVNDHMLKPQHRIISNASCTTNCLAPVAKVLHETFGIVRGLMTTVHAYTNDQRTLDQPHKDLRRARTAAGNIIPTSTGAAKAVGLVLPELKGKLNGTAMRVPVMDASIVDLVVELKKKVTVEEVNAAIRKAAEGPLAGILVYTEDPIVSSDIIGDPASSVFDAQSTMVVEDGLDHSMVKVMSWYDNEWGYCNRCADVMKAAFAR